MKKRVLSLVLCLVMALTLAACGSSSASDTTETDDTASDASSDAEEIQSDTASDTAASGTVSITVAYQYGLSYEPAIIAMELGLIEEAYAEATGGSLTVSWTQMSSGSDINTGIMSGSVDIGFMGLGPALTGIANEVGYKIFMNVSGQEHGMMTSDESITSLGDLVGSDTQIALVNIGSFQHIILAMALAEAGYDAHALDSNIVAMTHPDGMTALQTGSISVHLTSSPYIFTEREDESLHELTEINEIWSAEDSFIVGVASETMYEEQPELYQAICDGFAAAIDLINESPEEAAEISYELNGNTYEDELAYIQTGVYTTQTSKLYEFAQFMYEEEFLEVEIESYEDMVFDNVTGD